jgi:hypothetical protein
MALWFDADNPRLLLLLLLLPPGVPMMSVRDAMYDVMFDADNTYGVKREEILVDIVHVGD